MILEQGQTIYRTQGEYSDFRVSGFYRVLRTFDSDVVKGEFLALGRWPKQSENSYRYWYGSADDFMQWLVDELYLESCDQEFTEVWCDSGSKLIFA